MLIAVEAVQLSLDPVKQNSVTELMHDSSALQKGLLLSAASVVTAQNCICNDVTMDKYANIGVPGRMLYYYRRNANAYKIGVLNPLITTVVFVSHGARRNAQEYFCFMQNSVFQYFGTGESANHVLVFAPWFAAKSDGPASDQIYWTSNGWRICGKSSPDLSARTTSCTMIDNLLIELTNKTSYPNLQHIVITGHSAGGQLAQRYALGSGQVDEVERRGIGLRFVVMNPSSYAYNDGNRPELTPSNPTCDDYCPSDAIPQIKWQFKRPIQDCGGTYNNYPVGLENKNNYMSRTSNDVMIARYPDRDVVYSLGSADICNQDFNCSCRDHSLDKSCRGITQGRCRYARGYAYFNYLQWFYKKTVHKVVECEGIAHDGCAMFHCSNSQQVLFEKNPWGVDKNQSGSVSVPSSGSDFSSDYGSDSGSSSGPDSGWLLPLIVFVGYFCY